MTRKGSIVINLIIGNVKQQIGTAHQYILVTGFKQSFYCDFIFFLQRLRPELIVVNRVLLGNRYVVCIHLSESLQQNSGCRIGFLLSTVKRWQNLAACCLDVCVCRFSQDKNSTASVYEFHRYVCIFCIFELQVFVVTVRLGNDAFRFEMPVINGTITETVASL